jgi:predicted amidohydrolase
MFTLALAQIRVEQGRMAENLARAEARIAEAAAAGADVVLLPETLDAGWLSTAVGGTGSIPEGIPCRRLAAAARRHRVHVAAGLTERAGKRTYNAAVLLDSKGEVRLRHRKINELSEGWTTYGPGDRLGVADTPFGRVGLMICADAFAPGQVLSRSLGLMGAQVILSPCAWAMPADHDNSRAPYGWLWQENYGPVARDFRLWIAGCSNVGRIASGAWAGRACIGNSLVVNPAGEPVLRGPYGPDAEALLYIQIRPESRGRIGPT